MKDLKKFNKGFSFLEIIISSFIFSVGIVGVLTLMLNGLNYSIDSRNQVIASQLAQEGIELVRNIRDTGILVSGDDYNLSDNISPNKDKCKANYNSNNLDCVSLGDIKLYVDSNGFFNSINVSPPPAGLTATNFTRKIKTSIITNNPSLGTEQITITSIVSWDGQERDVSNCNSANKCFYIQDVLTN